MDRLQAMRIVAKVAETASFAKAARHLTMSPPAVTRAVAALEAAIGARLFLRTTRNVRLTEAGSRYVAECRRLLAEIAEAEAAAAGQTGMVTGTLSVTASVLFGRIHVLPILTDYLDAHPAVKARTLFVDRPVSIVEEGIDVAIRIGRLADSGLTALRVGAVRRVVCGAPGYLARHGIPATPADLKAHRIAVSTGAWPSPEWRFRDDERVTLHPTLDCNTSEAPIAAALAGWGLTRVLHYQIGPALADGRLRIVLADHEEAPLPIHVVFPEGRHASAKVRTFVDLAVERLRGNPVLNQ
ncbi:LysR family transcriptional regulator [Methylobacterium terricola]|uniref:LysR family transcriptional regulator n=1 Tax=Methylobacterium terricola TaxID=2583531 RepID=A0A5C4LGZ0_9HYPH|nr:LysR family transcriptional regulator [Methylobacterium terricola]TNC12262.1 LysR family transcriptional regulator [Methylobacterium terricola]